MTEVKHDLIARSAVVQLWTKTHFFVVLNSKLESTILHVLHIKYQETR